MPRVAPGDDSEFGMRWHPIRQEWAMHYGLDVIGFSTMYAPVSGRVYAAGWSGGWGLLVCIRADNGDEFWLAHCASIAVSRGDYVAAGQAVAVMGTTGNSTGVHLHFEVRPGGGSPVNPRDYYARAAGGAGGYTPTNPVEDDMTPDQAQKLEAIYAALFGPANVGAPKTTWAKPFGEAPGEAHYGLLDISIYSQTLIAKQAGELAAVKAAVSQLSVGSGVALDMKAIEDAAERGTHNALSGLTLKATT